MSSTLAGNLTLLGSVANLIVAEQARAAGTPIGFLAYFKVGLPLTLVTLAFGTAWLAWSLSGLDEPRRGVARAKRKERACDLVSSAAFSPPLRSPPSRSPARRRPPSGASSSPIRRRRCAGRRAAGRLSDDAGRRRAVSRRRADPFLPRPAG